jgi:hypothetical protein
MRKIIIRIVGYGQEIVQGTFTDEEIEILEKKVEEEDHSLGYIISDIVDILPDSYDWYDRDDELHVYGASVDASTLLIMDGSKEIKIENIWELEDEPYNGEIDSEEVCNFNGETNIITTISSEKGWIMDGGIEIEDDKEFDTSKLKVYIKDIIFDGYENSLITTIFYNGEEIFCDPDTSGKSFESYLEKKKKNGKENTNT